jgi:hypothetical protein
MQVHFCHHWRRYEGLFVVSFLALTFAYERVSITVLNFTLEFEFRDHQIGDSID